MLLRIALGLAGALLVLLVLAAINARRFRRDIARQVQQLFERSPQQPSSAQPPQTLQSLPPPVRAYLELALVQGSPAPRSVRFRHGGRFKPSLTGPWYDIRGEQYDGAAPPGFVWWGRMRIAPGLWIDARDRCLGGSGGMLVCLASTLRLFDRTGPALDQGAMLRLLSDLVLLPSVLLDARYVTWSPVDERQARATLTVGQTSVAGVFEFDDRGLPRRFSAERYRDTGHGDAVLSLWSGEYADYRRVHGWLVPHHFIGYWHEGHQRLPYADFVIEAPEYDVVESF
jgi:hypothetical protein